MKTKRLISMAAVLVGAGILSACGNGGLLDGMGSNGGNAGGMNAAQEGAVENLDGHWCADCAVPDGGAHVLEVGIAPESYTGGALSLVVTYVDPNGVVDASGAFRADRTLAINGHDMLASVPADAWKISPDGVRARITFNSADGLPAGTYTVTASITDPDLGTADASRTWVVAEPHEPTPTPTETHTEPSPTPTPDHTPTEATPTPTPSGDHPI